MLIVINIPDTDLKKLSRQTDTTYWDRSHGYSSETLYVTMEYVTFFLGEAAAEKTHFELLLGTETIPNGSYGMSSIIISFISVNARHQLNSRIDVLFSISQRASAGTNSHALV